VGRIGKIESVVNGTIATGHVKIVPRGILYYADQLLRGAVRFAKRTGNTVSMLNADNTFELTGDAVINTDVLKVSPPSNWIRVGSLVSIGPGLELVEVSDVLSDSLLTVEPLKGNYASNTKFLLHAVPIKCAATAPAGTNTIVVNSYYKIANGDVMEYLQSSSLLQSLTENDIESVTFLGTTGDPNFNLQYSLVLKNNLIRDIEQGEWSYLRAFPAYFASNVRVPVNLLSSELLGPFLLDNMSGRLNEGGNYKETLSIVSKDRAGNAIFGTTNSYETVYKNYPITGRPIPAHTPIFWETAEGVMRITPNRTVFKVNDLNQFCVGVRCDPNFIPGTTWRVIAKANESATIRFFFGSYPMQEFTLTANVSTPLTVGIPSGVDKITNIMINVLSTSPAGEVTLTDWVPTVPTVVSFDYALVARAAGVSTWQSSGLILKPIFLSSDLLKAYYDSGITYDSGKVYF
jgi:hypothetical protein